MGIVPSLTFLNFEVSSEDAAAQLSLYGGGKHIRGVFYAITAWNVHEQQATSYKVMGDDRIGSYVDGLYTCILCRIFQSLIKATPLCDMGILDI